MRRLSRSTRWGLRGACVWLVAFLVAAAIDPPGWLTFFFGLPVSVCVGFAIGGMLGETRSLVPLGFLIGSLLRFLIGMALGLEFSSFLGLLAGGFLGAVGGSIIDSVRRLPR